MRALLFTLLLSCAAVWVLATENEINFLFSGVYPLSVSLYQYFFCIFVVSLSSVTFSILSLKIQIGMIPGGSSESSSGGDSTPPSDGDCSWVDYDSLRDNLAQVVCGTNWPCASDSPGATGDNGGVSDSSPLSVGVWIVP